ncbi:MAG: phosphomannomutase/phosphoglucomutase [Acidobacteria bacterium]|nr:phosphomannomutase/phosphoglucomutase [Acidobacteriota bacterium]
MHIPSPHIFKRYDIRGIAGRELTPDLAEAIGRAVGTELRRRGKTSVVVGRDGRLSGLEFTTRFSYGILSTGLDVIHIGICPTPLVYFAIVYLEAGGGVAVTASHNPPEYNGFKICSGLDALYDDDIQALRRRVETEDFDQGEGRETACPIIPDYIEYLARHFGVFNSRPKVVVDAGNGTAGLVAPELLRRMKCRVVELYCHVDGRFPNHEADPTVAANLTDLIRLVRQQNAALGVAFDGDGDRIGVVDAAGRIVHGDQLLLLYARDVLSRQPGATIISEVKASRVLYDEVARLGGRPLMWKTGHSLIKAKMKETGAALAGEMSGHMFFADRYFGFDDALYAAGRLLEITDRTGRDLADLMADVPSTFNTPEIRLECPESLKEPLVRAVQEHYRATRPVIDIDGARVDFDDGWGLVRASNTQPLLVLRFEASTPDALARIQAEMTDTIMDLRARLAPTSP